MNSIHHIAIICSDRDAALEFYHTKLGFPIIRENYRPERDDWKIDLKLNETTELEEGKGEDELLPRPRWAANRNTRMRREYLSGLRWGGCTLSYG